MNLVGGKECEIFISYFVAAAWFKQRQFVENISVRGNHLYLLHRVSLD